MVNIDWTIAVQIVNFLAIIFILNILLYKPIRGILLQRKAKIEGLQDSITTTSQEAEARNQAFDQGIKEARIKGQKEKEALLQAATDEERAIISKINAKAQEDLVAVKEKIVQDTDTVKSALAKEVDTFADAITQKILGRAA